MKVGIIGAMASEVALLKEQLSEAQVTRVAGMEFCEGALGGTPVVFLHYPPVYDTAECRELLDTMLEYGIQDCYFGHIHGDHAAKKAPVGECKGIRMHLVSCDYIRFMPKLVRIGPDCK